MPYKGNSHFKPNPDWTGGGQGHWVAFHGSPATKGRWRRNNLTNLFLDTKLCCSRDPLCFYCMVSFHFRILQVNRCCITCRYYPVHESWYYNFPLSRSPLCYELSIDELPRHGANSGRGSQTSRVRRPLSNNNSYPESHFLSYRVREPPSNTLYSRTYPSTSSPQNPL